MKVVFIGASKFGLRCLNRVCQLSGIKTVGVITNRKRFTISYAPEGVENILYADFEDYAKKHDISSYVMKSRMTEPEIVKHITLWKPDLMIVVGWYHMIPRSLRKLAPTVGLHASLLPDYSGGAPLVWAIINGEKRTGITLFQFACSVDDGPIFSQASTEILLNDTIATLYERIEELGVRLLEEQLPLITSGKAVLLPQNENKRRVFPQRKPEEGRIDWNQPAPKIYDFIRAQTHPYPGAFTTHKGKTLHIWESELINPRLRLEKPLGFVYRSFANQIVVNCGTDTMLRLKTMEVDSKDISAEEWFVNFANEPVCEFV